MKQGLMCFDCDKCPLADKVNRAAVRYQVKFGSRPDTCYVNVGQYDGQTQAVDGVSIKTAQNVPRNHLWIGVENGQV